MTPNIACISYFGRDQFSVEKAKRVQYRMLFAVVAVAVAVPLPPSSRWEEDADAADLLSSRRRRDDDRR